MKKSILNRWLFGAMMLFTTASLIACVDDNEDEGMPYLETDVEQLAFSQEGGEATFTVRTNRPWSLAPAEGSEWITLDPVEGVGTTQVEVVLPGSSYAREGSFTISLSNTYGVYMTKTVAVKQGEVVAEELIYSETMGSASVSSPWPLVSAYTDWATEGTGAATVTYSGTNTSLRSSGLANEGSGPNVVFFGAAPATFSVNKITLTEAQTRLNLSFIGSFSSQGADGSYNNTFDPALFKVQLSGDGEKWSDLSYTKNDGDTERPYWIEASAPFVLAAPSEFLYIRFTANVSSAFRLDDIKLTTLNGNGPTIDLSQGTAGGDTPTPPQPTNALWHENFGAQGADKPLVADYTDWEKGGSAAANVTYTAASGKVSIRETGKLSAGYPDASGAAFCFLGTGSPAFAVGNLALTAEQTKLQLNFGGRYSKKNGDTYDNTFDAGKFHVYLSADGNAWKEITYTKAQTDEIWVYATADFTLAKATEKLYIKFAADEDSVFAVDDCSLTVGEGGQTVDLEAGDTPTPPQPGDDSFPGAGRYMMVWNIDGKTLAAIPAETYYILMKEVTVSGDAIAAAGNETCDWTIDAAAAEGRYTIKGSDNKYYAMKGTYNSFNPVDALGQADYSYDWTFAKNDDGTFKITNVDKAKWIQYKSYNGLNEVVASTEAGAMPQLYKLDATGTSYVLVGSGDTPTPPQPTEALTVKELVELAIAGTSVADKTVEGYVAAIGGDTENFAKGNVIVCDNDGAAHSGMVFYSYDLMELGLKVGDKVSISLATAEYAPYNNMREYKGIKAADVKILSSGATISYKTLTASQLVTNHEQYMSVPVQIAGARPTADAVGMTFTSGLLFTDGTEFTVYNRKQWAVGETVTVADRQGTIKGIWSVFDTTPQLIPTTLADIEPFASTGGTTPDPDPTPGPSGEWTAQTFASATATSSYNTSETEVADGWKGLYICVGAASTAYMDFTGTPISFQVKNKEPYLVSGTLTGGIQALKFESQKTTSCKTEAIDITIAVGGTTIWSGTVPVSTTFKKQDDNVIDLTKETAGFAAGKSVADLKGASFTIRFAPQMNTGANSVAIGNIAWMAY